MRNRLNHIPLFFYACLKLLFWVSVVLCIFAVPVAYIGLLMYYPDITLGFSFGIAAMALTFYIAVKIGKQASNPFR